MLEAPHHLSAHVCFSASHFHHPSETFLDVVNTCLYHFIKNKWQSTIKSTIQTRFHFRALKKKIPRATQNFARIFFLFIFPRHNSLSHSVFKNSTRVCVYIYLYLYIHIHTYNPNRKIFTTVCISKYNSNIHVTFSYHNPHCSAYGNPLELIYSQYALAKHRKFQRPPLHYALLLQSQLFKNSYPGT